jgi:hypothetical protein
MKSATALLMLVALLLMTSLIPNRFGQSFLVDQSRVPADAAQIAGRSQKCLQMPVRARL